MARFATAPAPKRQESLLETAEVNFRRAAAHLRLAPEMQTLLSTPLRELAVEIPLRRDDGTLNVFSGFRVQHNGVRGPVSGGIRFHPKSDIQEMRALAATNTWKAAVLNLPFGGAQGAIVCDPATLSKRELESLTRKYISRIHLVLGPYRDVPCPDVNSDSEVMGWIFDQFSRTYGYTPACVTGKPAAMGGSHNGQSAVGKGIAIIVREAARDLGLPPRGLRVAIQGFGTVGRSAALALEACGCRIIALSDSKSAIRAPQGMNVAAVIEHVDATRSLATFADAERIASDALLETDCDVLIPAATYCALNANNAARVRAKLVVEAASLATTPIADALFAKLGITVVPDILASGGSMVSSYFEWSQNLQQLDWDEAQMDRDLQKLLTHAYHSVADQAATGKTSLRTAAYCVGIERVARCERLRNS